MAFLNGLLGVYFTKTIAMEKKATETRCFFFCKLRDFVPDFFFFWYSERWKSFFEVFKVPKTKGIAFDKFDEIIQSSNFALNRVTEGHWQSSLYPLERF